jgi:transcription factor IIIB 90 kDa subunit
MAPPAPRAMSRRLGTINKAKPTPKAKAQPQKDKPCCDDPVHVDEDGMRVCISCGTQISENNIVADVTFEEDARGAATVQGGYINETARHARTLGTAARRIGGGERNTRQEIDNNGRRALAPIVARLAINDQIHNQALSLFGVAANFGFNAGRRTEEVAAACLFVACRRNAHNDILLIDIAEIIKVNVFRLGEVYKDLCKKCYIMDQHVGDQHLVDLEPLILKYCKRLEFGVLTGQVAQDAIKIARRMRRDWIVTGRHPAGLVGACIILAARMNNFRRTVREMVFVAKVADGTIARRVDEFRRTKAAGLTVSQFREVGVLLKHTHDPPALVNSKAKEEKWEEMKRKRQQYNADRESYQEMLRNGGYIDLDADLADIEAMENAANSRATSAVPEPENGDEDDDGDEEQGRRKRRRTAAGEETTEETPAPIQQASGPRVDADGFAIPALPGETENAENGQQRKRKRRITPRPQPVELSNEELITEQELQKEIDLALADEEVQITGTEIEEANREERVKTMAEQERRLAAEKEQRRRELEGIHWVNGQKGDNDTLTEADLAVEFENDPEVINCKLTEAEARIKEQIWVAHNEDWMRTQHEKKMLKKIAEAQGTDKPKRGGKGGRRKKKNEQPNDAETPAETPGEGGVAAMLAKKADPKLSKFVDYAVLQRVYGNGDASSASPSVSQSRAGSEAPSEAPSSRAGTERRSETPALLPIPQPTQQPEQRQRSPTPRQPEATQEQATGGAEPEDEEMAEEEPEEQYQSEVGSVVGGGWDDDISEVQDYGDDGEEDYQRTINDSWAGGSPTYGGEDSYYE